MTAGRATPGPEKARVTLNLLGLALVGGRSEGAWLPLPCMPRRTADLSAAASIVVNGRSGPALDMTKPGPRGLGAPGLC